MEEKLLCVTTKVNPLNLGGIETFCRTLTKMFGDKILYFSYPTKRKKYFKMTNIIELQCENLFEKIIYKLFGRRLLSIFKLRKLKFKIAILNFPKDIKLLSRNKSYKILVQHMNYDVYIKAFFYNNKSLIEKCKKELTYFILLSEYDRERFIKELGFSYNQTKVIRHSCEIELLKAKKEKKKKLIMICRLDNKHKRIDLAIKSMEKLQDFTLEIYGDGDDKEYLENLIKEKKLNNVYLCGGTNKVQEKLDENSIFIMTSDYEGYPITSIEAMRRGLPIVLRNTFDSALDIVENNGILLEKEWNEKSFAEAILKIYNNYEYYSENAIRMGERHSFEVIKREWENLFISLENNKNIY